jgi:uncharacterized membrane protein YdjX (TVP38/TMEM64 family)
MEASTISNNGREIWKPFLLLSFIVAMFILARVFDLGDQIGELRHWIQSKGILGIIVFILLYTAGAVAVFPGAALTLAGGAIFGSFQGVIVVSVASTLGAAVAFLVSRYFARETVVHWFSKNEKFRRLDFLIERHGAIIVAMTRLVSIVPYNVLNYAFGITRVPFGIYIFWTWLCMLPVTILLVVGADAAIIGITGGKTPWVLIGVLTVVFLALIILIHMARRKLKEREEKV